MTSDSPGVARRLRLLSAIALSLAAFPAPAQEDGGGLPQFAPEEAMFWGEEEILISATLYETPLRMTPVIASVVPDREIRDMGARSIKDVLMTLPGIDIYEFNGLGVGGITIRGWGMEYASQILFMIDGHRLAVTGMEPLDLYDDLMVDDIKRIEVIRGPVSSLYGADAMSGVINIITKEPEDVDGIEVKLSRGTWDTNQANVLLGKKNGDLGVLFDLNYLKSSGPRLGVEKDFIYFMPCSLSPGRTLFEREKADMDLKIEYGNLKFTGRYTTKRHGPYIGLMYALNERTRIERDQLMGDVSYEEELRPGLKLLAKVYGDHYRNSSFIQQFPENFFTFDIFGDRVEFPEGMLADGDLKASSLGTEGRLTWDAFEGNRLVAGMMGEWRRLYDISLLANYNPLTRDPYEFMCDVSDFANFIQPAERNIGAGYLEDTWTLAPALTLSAGARYDKYSDVGDSVNPRVGLVWACCADTYLKASYGEAFRPPSFLELYAQNNTALIGNPDLRPEKARTAQVGVEYDVTRNLKVRLAYFFSRLRDLIVIEQSGLPNQPSRFINMEGEVDVQGGEAEVRSEWRKGSYAYANYSYLHSLNRETGQGLSNLPAHKGNVGVTVSFLEYFRANASVMVRGERARIAQDTRADLPAYGLVNLTLIAEGFLDTFAVEGSVYNLFDKRYYNPSPYGSMPSDFPKEGRSFMLSVRYTF